MALKNFFGQALPTSSAWVKVINWLLPTEDLKGSALSDKITGGGGGHIMSGLSGDDTYYVKVLGDAVVEAAGAGIDTVNVSGLPEYYLPSNVENLTVGGRADAYGNSLNNIITGLNNKTNINGMGGNDILIGGLEADSFVFTEASGYDAIADFSALEGDKIRLDLAAISTFAQVQAAMTQDGADVILRFSDTDAVRIQNATASSFKGDDFQFRIDTSKLQLTFAEEFSAYPSFYDEKTATGVWDTTFHHGSKTGPKSKLSHTNNDELQIYVDPSYSGSGSTALGIDPFSTSDGVLTITAQKTPADAQAALWDYRYTSGLLTTANTFYQQYGYFEMRASMPAGQGVWPAFWLLPEDQTYGLELDVVEQIGGDKSYGTSHFWTDGVRDKLSAATFVSDVTEFHTYGMLWTATETAWYIDGVEVFSMKTPSDLNRPMYVLANMAIGGRWPGDPPADFTSAQMKIDYIRAYAVDGQATSETVNAGGGDTRGHFDGTGGDDVITGSSIDDVITGGSGADLLDGRTGNDTMDGNEGSDTAVFAESSSAVAVNLSIGGAQNTGGAGTDTLISIENVIGSAHDDRLTGNSGNNILSGGYGHDTLDGGAGADVLDGGGGVDTATYANATAKVAVDLSITSAQDTRGAGIDTLTAIENLVGSAYADVLKGDFGANALDGGNGADSLSGGNGRDVLDGGAGADILTGGLAADTFVFSDKNDSKGFSYDKVTDFSRGESDLIDLSRIDANVGLGGNQAFIFVGPNAFTNRAGELRFISDAAGSHIYGDVHGDGSADFHILVCGVKSLLAADFIL